MIAANRWSEQCRQDELINTLQFLYLDDLRMMDFGADSLEDARLLLPRPIQLHPLRASWRHRRLRNRLARPEQGERRRPRAVRYLGHSRWRISSPSNSGCANLAKSMRRLALKEFRLIKSAQEHRELLLPPTGADGRGFGLVAMRDVDRYRRFRESLEGSAPPQHDYAGSNARAASYARRCPN